MRPEPMHAPGNRPRCANPAAAPATRGPRQALRVLGGDGRDCAVAPTVVMPRANTDLAALLSGDKAVCVQRKNESVAAEKAPGPAPPPSPAAAEDADLARVNEAWPALPGNIRAAIALLVRETPEGEK